MNHIWTYAVVICDLNARLGVAAVHKSKINPIYTLRAQLISPRRETLKLLGLKVVSKTLSLTEILSAEPDNHNGKAD
jgi:hypothetical protein